MEIKLNFEKFIFYSFIVLFLFSNILQRITNFNFNAAFYIIFLILIILSIKYIKLNKINKWCIFTIFFCFLSVLNLTNSNLKANVMSLKDIVIQLFCLFVSYIFIKYKNITVNLVNKLYLPFILYGIFQEIIFYQNKMASILPWDYEIIIQTLSSGKSTNMMQPGGLLRFWGCMNSFVEYQISIVFIICLIWLYNDYIKNKLLLKVNLILMVLFLCLAIERSPIMMLLILLLIWKFKEIVSNIKKIFVFAIIFIVCIFTLSFFSKSILNNTMLSGAYERLYNVIALNFNKDEAILDRQNNQWNIDKQLVSDPKTFFGLGPATVAPSSQGYFEGYIGPHNNFLGYYIGYGFLGLFLFVYMLIMMIKYLNELDDKYKYYGFGTIAAFCCMAIFNTPFFGKQGIIFFLTIGILINDKQNYKIKQK